MYQAAGQQAGTGDTGHAEGGQAANSNDDVVDAEFTNVA
jgi:hypothetical protein